MSPSPTLDTVMETVISLGSVNLLVLRSMETFSGSLAAKAVAHRQISAMTTTSAVNSRLFIACSGEQNTPFLLPFPARYFTDIMIDAA